MCTKKEKERWKNIVTSPGADSPRQLASAAIARHPQQGRQAIEHARINPVVGGNANRRNNLGVGFQPWDANKNDDEEDIHLMNRGGDTNREDKQQAQNSDKSLKINVCDLKYNKNLPFNSD